MEIKIDSLIPYDKIKENADDVFRIVDKNDKVLLLRNNQPAYIITKLDTENSVDSVDTFSFEKATPNLKLQEAMKLVLLEAENHTMHVSELADEIFKRRLYLQKNGGKAHYNQIRARLAIIRICSRLYRVMLLSLRKEKIDGQRINMG
jgi:antitoxin Phd